MSEANDTIAGLLERDAAIAERDAVIAELTGALMDIIRECACSDGDAVPCTNRRCVIARAALRKATTYTSGGMG